MSKLADIPPFEKGIPWEIWSRTQERVDWMYYLALRVRLAKQEAAKQEKGRLAHEKKVSKKQGSLTDNDNRAIDRIE